MPFSHKYLTCNRIKENIRLTGKLLIAKPYLGDPNFERSVVLVCAHGEEGAFGLVLNQATDKVLSDFFEDVMADSPVFMGGPVENRTLHFLHKRGDIVEGAIELQEGLYWSGDFEQIKTLLNTGLLKENEIRFYLGYSGWGEGQIEKELQEDVWVLADGSVEVVFGSDTSQIWRNALRKLGGNYIIMANSPSDPRLN